SRVVVRGKASGSSPAASERTLAELSGWEPWPQPYSGSRTYEKTVKLTSAPKQAWLDFGEGTVVDPSAGRRPANGMRALLESPVREAAQVGVNGKLAGSVKKPPYRVDIGGLLKSGDNAIKIVVANTAMNEMATKPLPDYKELNAKFG